MILDICCGSKMFWKDKNHPHVIYVDKRYEEKGYDDFIPSREICPDAIVDFREASSHPFLVGKKFKLIVFDPPHLFDKEETFMQSRMKRAYGYLDKSTWKDDIKKGFDEAWKLLEVGGTLIFKWNETTIKKKEVLEVIGRDYLFGHPTGSKNLTHWITFMKFSEEE